MFVSIIQVAIAVGSALGGSIVDHAGVRADFTLGCGLAVLGLMTLSRLAALERPARGSDFVGECEPSAD
jgi:predicted MFS family arabinose efflux permease